MKKGWLKNTRIERPEDTLLQNQPRLGERDQGPDLLEEEAQPVEGEAGPAADNNKR